MEEPLATRPTSPGGGAHDVGDLADMLGYEEAWATPRTSSDPAGARTETAGNEPSSGVQDPPTVTKQATPMATPVIRIGLGCPI